MNSQVFTNNALELANKYNSVLIIQEADQDWYGVRRKYFVDTCYGKLYFTIIDQPFIPMRWRETFDRQGVEKLFGVKPGKNGRWDIHGEDPEFLLKEFELRLDALTYKVAALRKVA